MIVNFFYILLKQLTFRFNNIGKLPICNCKKERAPHIGKYCFILCWRCTSILTSFYVLTFLDAKKYINIPNTNYTIFIFISSLLLTMPTFIDGVRQYFFGIESTNKKRIITGLLAGIGLYFIIFLIKNKLI